jgi:V/A-type H+/Na+-transporting ATPase subunit A
MPIVAREASIYLGMTAAEYFRDMGLRVAILADSLSRWAEALREIGSRLQEMPGEEGFPTYLSDRLAKLYERAGSVTALGAPPREGAITFISAISPPGGDFSEPVTQSALRVAGALWALDAGLAHRRQFPAVDWETSYSLYEEPTLAWFSKEVAPDWESLRREILALLQRDGEVREIAGLVGADALQDEDRLALEAARIVREAVLAQSAFEPGDAVSSPAKTHLLASLAVRLLRAGRSALAAGVPFERIDLEPARRVLVALRARPEDELAPGAAEAGALIGAIEGSGGRA